MTIGNFLNLFWLTETFGVLGGMHAFYSVRIRIKSEIERGYGGKVQWFMIMVLIYSCKLFWSKSMCKQMA